MERHRELTGQFYECTPQRQVVMARSYRDDPNLAAVPEPEFFQAIVEWQAEAQGVDVANAQW